MGSLLINERKLVDENVFLYEDRLSNPTTRFQEETPTYTTYYHIDSDDTTTDAGFEDVASVLGSRSPIRFNKTTDFPLIISQEINLSLQELDQGLDTEFNGEAVVLPGTIKPLQNDFFIIPYLRSPFIFRVVNVDYDYVKTDNYYKIEFVLDAIDEDRAELLEKQTAHTYTCLLNNIGTENVCIIDDESHQLLQKINAMYDDIADTYKAIFFNKRYNCFLGLEANGRLLYDPHQAKFINTHNLFNKPNDFNTIYLSEHFSDKMARIKYEKTIYRVFERRRPDLLTPFAYTTVPGIHKRESGFAAYNDSRIDILDIPLNDKIDITPDNEHILSDEFILSVKMNGEQHNSYAELIQQFIRNEPIGIYDIPLNLIDELLALEASLELFFFVPIILYIIRTIVNEEMKK